MERGSDEDDASVKRTDPEDSTDGERTGPEDSTGVERADPDATSADATETEVPVETDDEEWRFSLQDIRDREGEETDGTGGGIAGTLEANQPLEPGDIDLENAFFVALGVLIVVGLIAGTMLGL
jgi:hypothetical protein